MTDTDRANDARDDFENSDAGIQGGIEFALLQMSAENLTRIDADVCTREQTPLMAGRG